jgi:hypothetical protein
VSRFRNSLSGLVLLTIGLFAAPGLWAQQGGSPGLKERLLNTSASGEVDFASRKIEASSVASQSFEARGFSGTKSFEGKAYEPKRFLGVKIPWLQDRTATTSPFAGADTTFATGSWQQENRKVEKTAFAEADKKQERPEFAVQAASAEGSTEGYWQAFQESISQELSHEEIRKLLNRRR